MRLFVAVWPGAATRARLRELDLASFPRLRPVPPEHWHVTLRFLGEVPEDLVPRLNDALGSVAAGWPGPFRVDMGPATAWFSGARVLQVPVAGLDALAGAVRDATIPIVPLPATGDPPFVGHLTLGRAKGGGADPATRAALEGIPFLATGPVGGFDLVASLPSPAGVRYAPLAQFELNPY